MDTVIRDLETTLTQTLPYLILSGSALGYQTLMVVLFPITLRLLIKGFHHAYDYWHKSTNYFSLDLHSSMDGHRDNLAYASVSWYLSHHIKELKCKALVCRDAIALPGDYHDYRLSHFETMFSMAPEESIQIPFQNPHTDSSHTIELTCWKDSGPTADKTREVNVLHLSTDQSLEFISQFIQHCSKELRETLLHSDMETYHYYEYEIECEGWNSHPIQTIKSFDNVFLEPTIKHQVVNLLDTFVTAEAEYRRLGIPYKKGMIFHGPPGCGKTACIYALTHYLQRNIYFIRFDELKTGQELKRAIIDIPKRSVIVIEDIDVYHSTHKRSTGDNGDKSIRKTKHKHRRTRVDDKAGDTSQDSDDSTMFATILEILDGYNYLFGSVIILTTNHLDKLDPALIRAGRMDQHIQFDFLTLAVAQEIVDYFLGDRRFTLEKLPNVVDNKALTSAEFINGVIMPHLNNPEQIRALCNKNDRIIQDATIEPVSR
jgi:hypothetical protein